MDCAAATGNEELVTELINSGADINPNDKNKVCMHTTPCLTKTMTRFLHNIILLCWMSQLIEVIVSYTWQQKN